MTLDFWAHESQDGYQYVQVLTDNTSTCESGAGSGDPSTIQLSRYMAGIEIMKGSPYTELFKKFSFPVLSIGLRPLLLQTFSGGGTAPDDSIVDSNPDDSDDDSRAKDRMNLDDFGNLW